MLPSGRCILRIGYPTLKGDTRWAGYRVTWARAYRAQYHMRWIPTANGKITARRSILRIGCPPMGHFPGPLGSAEIFLRGRLPNGRLRMVEVGVHGPMSRYENAFRAIKFEGLDF